MCHPQPTTATPAPKSYGFDRRRPTCWWLAEIISGWPHPSFATGRNVYVSWSESGQYRMLGQGNAVMVMSEAVAARHLVRCRDSAGQLIRVRDQQKQTDRFNEAMAESRRTATTVA